MIGMTAAVGAVLIIACLVGFTFYMLLSEHNKAQSRAERSTLGLAKILNEDDRVGQVNNVIARSRELVFLSRRNQQTALDKKLSNWEPLARFLVEEARAGADLVEGERKNQIDISKKAVRYFSDHYNLHTIDKPIFSLPFFHTWDSEISDVYVGSVINEQSNVLNTDIYPDLREFDEKERYFQKGSNLYLGNINAKLPSPDNDLDFKLAAVHAPVDSTVAQPRILNSSAFKQSACIFKAMKFVDSNLDQIPTAVRTDQLFWITAISKDEQQVQVSAIASSNGAMPAP